MLTDKPDDAVFAWLAEGLDPRPPAYLQLLGPGGGEEGDRVLANLGTVADRLREDPGYWGELIRARNWRHTLVGCSAVLLTRDPRFLDGLLHRFQRGSWVAPQLAVALGLVHPTEASAGLEAAMRRGDPADPKTMFSAYAVLKLLGHRAADEFEAGEVFRRAQGEDAGTSAPAYDGLMAVRTVHHQWAFWNNRASPPVRRPAAP